MFFLYVLNRARVIVRAIEENEHKEYKNLKGARIAASAYSKKFNANVVIEDNANYHGTVDGKMSSMDPKYIFSPKEEVGVSPFDFADDGFYLIIIDRKSDSMLGTISKTSKNYPDAVRDIQAHQNGVVTCWEILKRFGIDTKFYLEYKTCPVTGLTS